MGRTMKILVINGSYRGKKGFTRFLADRLLEGVVDAGAESEIIDLVDKKINRCLSCGVCHTGDHRLKCVYDDKDDVADIFKEISQADIIVYATPIYIFSMSGLMKIFLERMYSTADVFDLRLTRSGLFFHHVNRAIGSKPFVLLTCCDNNENETVKNVISYFRTYAKFHDAQQVGLLVRKTGRFAGHGKNPEAAKQIPRLSRVYEGFRRAGRDLALTGRVSRFAEKEAALNILPIPPLLRLLNRLRPVKKKLVERARSISGFSAGDI